jgi:hypothetical protein
MTNSEKPDGLMYPTQRSYPPGAGNPNQAALQSTQQNAGKLHAINKLAGGKKYRGGAVTVPQMQMGYTPQGGEGTNPNAQITDLSKTSTQGAAWSKSDNLGPKQGGSRKSKKGGNPNLYWPCMSGGKKKTRKTKKHRKSRRSKRSRRTKRSRRNKY